MKIIALIPARLESSRLPSKALKDICGLPAIVHCYRRTKLSKKIDEVFVCTDSNEIKHSVESHGGKVIMTSDHINGSERIYEASQQLQDCDYVINVQGDEVLVNPEHIDSIISTLTSDQDINYVLGVTDFTQSGQKAVFKAVLDHANNLIYCSREDIPSKSINTQGKFLKVVFIVGFKKDALKEFVNMPECILENQEPNEFLRIIYNGKKIKTSLINNAHISLDTEEDLFKIRDLMKVDPFLKIYK